MSQKSGRKIINTNNIDEATEKTKKYTVSLTEATIAAKKLQDALDAAMNKSLGKEKWDETQREAKMNNFAKKKANNTEPLPKPATTTDRVVNVAREGFNNAVNKGGEVVNNVLSENKYIKIINKGYENLADGFKNVQDLFRDHYSILDKTNHATLDDLKNYDKKYLEREKNKLALLEGTQKEEAKLILEKQEKDTKAVHEYYEKLYKLRDEYFEKTQKRSPYQRIKDGLGLDNSIEEERKRLLAEMGTVKTQLENTIIQNKQDYYIDKDLIGKPEPTVYANDGQTKQVSTSKTTTTLLKNTSTLNQCCTCPQQEDICKSTKQKERPQPEIEDLSIEVKPLDAGSFTDSMKEQMEKGEESLKNFSETYKDTTNDFDDQTQQRIGILSQLGEAYANNTAGMKDAFSTITGLFKGNDPIVDGILNFAEKNLPKLLSLFEKTNEEINEDVKESTDKRNEAFEQGMGKTENIAKTSLEQIQEHVQLVIEGISMVFEAINSSLDEKIEEAQERYEVLSEKYDEVTEKIEESNARIAQLHEEAKNAQGGRAIVIQEQLSREIEANKELANEQKSIDEEKKKAEAEKEKLEKQQRKNELKIQIVQAVANVALGITKALSMGPILGPIMAAVVAVAGAIQIAQLNKQMSKLADGGLLGGKTHAQGGMRIEGTNIEVEGGEYVVNRASTRKNLGLISYINSQRRQLTPNDINGYFSSTSGYGESPNFKTMFATGGVLPSEDIMNTYEMDAAIQAIESINLQPVVSVVDIANVQKNLTTVTDWTNTSSF